MNRIINSIVSSTHRWKLLKESPADGIVWWGCLDCEAVQVSFSVDKEPKDTAIKCTKSVLLPTLAPKECGNTQ